MERPKAKRKRVIKKKTGDVEVVEALDKIGQVLIEKDYGLSDREERKKNQKRKELFDIIRKIQKRNKDVDPDEAMRIALEAQQAVRSVKRNFD